MTNNGKETSLAERSGVDILKLVSQKWMFMIPVKKYPDYEVTGKVNSELEKFVKSIGCKLIECGSGSTSGKVLIVAYTVKIEDEDHVEDLVQKVKNFLNEKVVPIV